MTDQTQPIPGSLFRPGRAASGKSRAGSPALSGAIPAPAPATRTDNGADNGSPDLDRRLGYLFDDTAGPHVPVVVLSNSLGTSRQMWDGQLAALRREFRILSYDTRGHSTSTLGGKDFAIDDLAEDVVALLDELGLDQVIFCGLSMGGMIGQCLGVRFGERIARLVLCNTGAKIGSAASWNARIESVQSGGMSPITDGVLERWFTAEFRQEHPAAVALVREQLLATSPEGYAGCCAAIRDADFRENVHAIAVPTLIISGSFDPSTPPSDGQFLARAIDGARYLELPAAHLSNIEAQQAFNAGLLDFLRENDDG